MPDRSFYGGEAPGARAGGGEISAGVYTGPKLFPEQAPWKCPACKADQSGPLEEGCQACGSGTAKARHVEAPARPVNQRGQAGLPPPTPAPRRAQLITALRGDMSNAMSLYQFALNWSAANTDASLADAFVAGYQHALGKTMGAPPVTTDLPTLSVAGKPRRTIKAALEFFKEQILPRAHEEVSTGEWCSIEEIDALIAQFTDAADEETGDDR